MENKTEKQSTYTSLTAWLRNPDVWSFFVSMAVMALVSLAFFAPDNIQGNSLQQHDMQQGASNGEEGRAYEAQTGEKALWTNALFSGMPTFQISPSYPSNALFTWLNDVYGLGLPAPSNLLFMMMFGMLIACYCMRIRRWYALTAALAWGLSSYFVIIIGAGHIWKFVTLTYVPPTIGAMLLAYRGKYIRGAGLLSLFTMLELNANHPQITYYSLYIMGTLFVALLVSAIRKHTVRRWATATGACLVAGALAVGANAPALYNTYEYSKETKRAQSELTPLQADKGATDGIPAERPTGGLPKAEIGGWSNTPSESFSLLIPNIKGGANIKPEKGRNNFLSLADTPGYQADAAIGADDAFGIIPQFSQYFGGKELTNGPFYVGALIVALFLLGAIIVGGPVKWSLVVVTLFSVLLAMGNHFEALTDFMIYNIPLYNKFRAAETALVIAALCMPLLGVIGLQKLFSTDGDAWRRYRTAILVAFGVPVVLCLVASVAPAAFGNPLTEAELQSIDGMREQLASQPVTVQAYLDNTIDNICSLRLDMVRDDAMRSLLFLGLGLIAVYFTARRKAPVWLGTVMVAGIVMVDLYSVDKRFISTESFAEQELAAADPLAADAIDNQILQDKDYYRVMDLTAFGDARRSFYHHMVGGYHAAKLNRYNDLIERRMHYALAMGGQYIAEARQDTVIEQADPKEAPLLRQLRADYRVLDMLNTRYIITKDGLVRNDNAAGPAWLAREIKYVDNADAEMGALATVDPVAVAVADKRFKDVLGADCPSAAPGDTVVMTGYTPNTVSYKVTAKNGGIAVFSEVWFPWGWHATVDGQPAQLGRVNYVLRALRVPAGTHTVSMTFDPQSIHTTSTLAYICVTLIYLLLSLALFIQYTAHTKPGKPVRLIHHRK